MFENIVKENMKDKCLKEISEQLACNVHNIITLGLFETEFTAGVVISFNFRHYGKKDAKKFRQKEI